MSREFNGFKSREDYLNYNSEYNKKRKEINPNYIRKDLEQHMSYTAEWYKKQRKDHPKKMMLKHARDRARTKKLGFNLLEEDFNIPDLCPVLGIPLIRQEGKSSINSPVLDRIDNTKGYIKGNVMVISHRANRIKSDASLEELFKIYCYVKNYTQPTCS